MDADQLRQLIEALPRPQPAAGRKLNALESTDGAEWRTWLHHFRTVALINGWNNMRQKREMQASMVGDASRLVADIAIIDDPAQGPPGQTIEQLADLYEERFLPAAAGEVARIEFHAAAQLPSETVTQWHGRLRQIFIRAYPNDAANVEASQLLRQTFALGLTDTETSRYVLDRVPPNYAAALNLAQQKQATEAALAHRRKGGVNQIGQPARYPPFANQNPGRKCWFCNQAGHLKQQCEGYKKSLQNGGGRGGRGRGRGRGGRGRSGGRNGRRVNQITKEEGPEKEEEELWETDEEQPAEN